MVADLVHLVRGEAAVDVDDPGIEIGGGKGERHLRCAVFADHHQAVAGAHAQRAQGGNGIVDGGAQLGVGPVTAAVVQGGGVRGVVRPAAHDGAEPRRQGCQQGMGIEVVHLAGTVVGEKAANVTAPRASVKP